MRLPNPFRQRDSASGERLASAREGAEAASRELDEAKTDHAEQRRKREQEQEALIQRLDRLAGDDSNHLGQRVLRALTEGQDRSSRERG